jgi:hypothetical protein
MSCDIGCFLDRTQEKATVMEDQTRSNVKMLDLYNFITEV